MRSIRLMPAIAWLFLLSAPPLLLALDEPFYITLLTRLMIFGLAASSLNLVLGYGGMVSFGHAAFFGMGGYTIGIMAQQFGIHSPVSEPQMRTELSKRDGFFLHLIQHALFILV